MAEADTALLEPDTAQAEELAPAEPETGVLSEDAETGTTAEQGEETEPETLTRAEAERLADERAAAARAELEAQRQSEMDQARAQWADQQAHQRRESAVKARSDATIGNLRNLAKWAYEQSEKGVDFGDIQFNQQVLNAIADPIKDMVAVEELDAAGRTHWQFLQKAVPDYRPTPQQVAAANRAVGAGDLGAYFQAQYDMTLQAGIELGRKQRDAELAKEAQERTKTDAVKATEAQRKAQGRPTPITGGGTPGAKRTYRTQQEVDGALYRGEIDTRTAREWLSKSLPYS